MPSYVCATAVNITLTGPHVVVLSAFPCTDGKRIHPRAVLGVPARAEAARPRQRTSTALIAQATASAPSTRNLTPPPPDLLSCSPV